MGRSIRFFLEDYINLIRAIQNQLSSKKTPTLTWIKALHEILQLYYTDVTGDPVHGLNQVEESIVVK